MKPNKQNSTLNLTLCHILPVARLDEYVRDNKPSVFQISFVTPPHSEKYNIDKIELFLKIVINHPPTPNTSLPSRLGL